jgi:predicted O-methyltransferase YrrM
MQTKLHRLKMLLRHLIRGKSKYYLHSPFVYQFYLHVLQGAERLDTLEQRRNSLISSTQQMVYKDMGASGRQVARTVGSIAASAAITHKHGLALYRLVQYLQPQIMLELGTNLGLGTSYLALANRAAQVHTIEGIAGILAIAQDTFKELGIENVHAHQGDFDDVLGSLLPELKRIDLLFIDGNHRRDSTIRYFEKCLPYLHDQSVVVVDDIYWSEEMTEAWEYIKSHASVTLTLDIYRMGFVFFRREKLAKEHFRLYY